MNKHQVNQQMQDTIQQAQKRQKFSLTEQKVGSHLAGDYLYIVEKKHCF